METEHATHEITLNGIVYHVTEDRNDGSGQPAFGKVANINGDTISVQNVNGKEELDVWKRQSVITEEEYIEKIA